MTYNSRKKREAIEQEGVPYIITAMLHIPFLKLQLEDITLATDKNLQFLGIDYMAINKNDDIIFIDSKYHTYKPHNIISIEITKANGCKGWGIDTTLATDYIIDFYNTTAYTGYYVIDCHKLHSFMATNYTNYPVLYANAGKEDYRGVPIKDLWLAGVIIYSRTLTDINIEDLKKSWWYKNHIEPKLPLLIHH